LTQDPTTGNNKIKIPVKRPGMVLKTKTPRLKIKPKAIITLACGLCKNPISDTNPLLTCKNCGKQLCSICENKIDKEEIYLDGDNKHSLDQEFPLCLKCYTLNIGKQKERISIHRRYKQLNDSLPENPDIWFSTGERFIGSDRFYLAAMCFNEAIKMDKEYTSKIIKNWNNTGTRLISESRSVEAVQCFDEALILNEKLEDVWLNRGKTLESLGRTKEAIASFNKVIELNEQNFEAYSHKGFLLASEKDQDGFNKNIKAALDLKSSSDLVWLYKTKAHLVLNQFKDAVNSSEQALKINPDNVEALINKCEGLTNSNECLSAVECSKKILELDPDNVKGFYCKAKALLGLGKNKEALELFDEVLKRDPNGETINYNEIINNTLQAGGIERVKEELEFDLDIQQAQLSPKKPLTPEETHLLELEREKHEKEERRKLQEEERRLLAETERLKGELAEEEKRKQEEEANRKQVEEKARPIREEEPLKGEERKREHEEEDAKQKLEGEQKNIPEEEEHRKIGEQVGVEADKRNQEPEEKQELKVDEIKELNEESTSNALPPSEGSVSSVQERVNELPKINELKKLYELIKDPELSAKIDQSELKSLIHENSKILKSELHELKSSGVIISNLIELYKKAGEKYKKENYLDAIKIIIEIIQEKEKYEKDFFNIEIEKLSNRLSEVDSKYPVETFNLKLIEVKKELSANNLPGVRAGIFELKKLIALAEKYYPKAKQLIENLEQKIKAIEQAGININEAKHLLNDMKKCFETNDFQKLPTLKKQCLKSIEESRIKYKKLLEDIKMAQNQNVQLKNNGIDDLDCKHLLKKSKMMVIAGQYDEAKTLISKCIERSNELIKK
jgi:tetratricopeptide (TPR) repeat protein